MEVAFEDLPVDRSQAASFEASPLPSPPGVSRRWATDPPSRKGQPPEAT